MDHEDDCGWRAGGVGPLRQALARSCAACAVAMALLVVAGVHGAIYLALDGRAPSADLVLQLAPRAWCALLHGCSP